VLPDARATVTAAAPYVVDGRFLTTRPTGLHRVARGFVSAARDAGVDVEVWAPGRTDDPLVDRIVPVAGGRPGGRLWEQVALPVLARGRTIWSLTNTAPLAVPGVVVVHDLAASVGPQWFAKSMRAYAKAVRAAARRARLVITVSQSVRDELAALGVDPARIVVVSPAVDPQFAPAAPDAIEVVRSRLGLHRPYAVVTGWADPRKDAATAVLAHRRVVDDSPHDLVLVGSRHPTFAPVRLPDNASIKRPGHVTDADLVALLSGASVLLYPSRYEGFGLPPLEALACGTPAVVSDIPVLRESTQGLVRLAPPGDVEAWAAALADGLNGRLSCGPASTRSPAAVGRQLAVALSTVPAASPYR
jgi:glycosyltransferase involved in cell wall biosynthesis